MSTDAGGRKAKKPRIRFAPTMTETDVDATGEGDPDRSASA
jgi:hypothetical protein